LLCVTYHKIIVVAFNLTFVLDVLEVFKLPIQKYLDLTDYFFCVHILYVWLHLEM
jgi:hypothetical protein